MDGGGLMLGTNMPCNNKMNFSENIVMNKQANCVFYHLYETCGWVGRYDFETEADCMYIIIVQVKGGSW